MERTVVGVPRHPALLALPALVLAVAGLFHPHHLTYDTSWRWFALHLPGLVVFPLVGLALASVIGDPLLSLFGATSLADPAAYPLLALGVAAYGLLCLPIVNAFARSVEADADTYAFDLIGDGRPFAAAMRRLSDQNLGEERPPRWAEILLYTHPPIWRRIARAEAARHG